MMRSSLLRRQNCRLPLQLVLLVSLMIPSLITAASPSSDVQQAIEAAGRANLTGEALAVEQLTLNIGLAKLSIVRANLYPATPVAGRPREFVLIGHALLGFEPPNEVEAHQLEIFTGKPVLLDSIHEAVFVLGHDAAIDALLARRQAPEEPSEWMRAEELFRQWHDSKERKQLHADAMIARRVIDDPGSQTYFAGWLDSVERGRLLYVVDPWRQEQIELGQFKPIKLSKRMEKKVRKFIHKQTRRNGFSLFELQDVGTWHSWVRGSMRRGDQNSPGSGGYEPSDYRLDVTIDPTEGTVRGTATVTLVADALAGRAVALTIIPTIDIDEARVGGRPLLLSRVAGSCLVFLDARPSPGEKIELEVDFSGPAFDKFKTATFSTASFSLADTAYWYPHVGDVDLATYDVTLRWPKKLDVLSPGRLIASGVDGEEQFSRWVIERPTFATTFELGRYDVSSRKVGEIVVQLAIDKLSKRVLADEEVLLNAIAGPLDYLSATFGELPTKEITLVTSIRDSSQSFRGFVTLSTLMLRSDLFLGSGQEDPRTLIAHELAHQWWGHRMAALGDRDFWLNESLADYSAEIYARNRLGDLGDRRSPTEGWALDVALQVGKFQVGGLGPVTLGPRLALNFSDYVFQTIVYKKGALVAQMLAGLYGEAPFNDFLGKLAEAVDYRPMSTEQFLETLEQAAGLDLDAFARSYVYGTYRPSFEVEYTIEEDPVAGGYTIRGTVERVPAVRIRYRLVEKEEGIAIARNYEVEDPPEWAPLAVPVEIAMVEIEKAVSQKTGSQKNESPKMGGYLFLEDSVQNFEFEVAAKPRSFTVDPHRAVFATFFDSVENRFETDVMRAMHDLARGDVEQGRFRMTESLDLLQDATVTGDDLFVQRIRRLMCHVSLGLIALDNDQLPIAQAHVDQARAVVKEFDAGRTILGDAVTALEARVLLRDGQAKKAFNLLRKKGVDDLETESLLTLAIAARQMGELEHYKNALESEQLAFAHVESLDLLGRE